VRVGPIGVEDSVGTNHHSVGKDPATLTEGVIILNQVAGEIKRARWISLVDSPAGRGRIGVNVAVRNLQAAIRRQDRPAPVRVGRIAAGQGQVLQVYGMVPADGDDPLIDLSITHIFLRAGKKSKLKHPQIRLGHEN
jgi:hypothetical protein